METTTRQVIITLWREANIALIILYFCLLILNTVLNKFVQALVPLTGIGWLAALGVVGWLWFTRPGLPPCSQSAKMTSASFSTLSSWSKARR